MGWGVNDYPEPTEPRPEDLPHCPICGEWCDVIYRNRDREIVGCDNCIEDSNSWNCDECFPGKE